MARAGEQHPRPSRPLLQVLDGLGVAGDTPLSTAKHVRLINRFTLVAQILLLCFAPVNWLARGVEGHRELALLEVLTALALCGVYVLQARGRHVAAVGWLLGAGGVMVAAGAQVVGREAGFHFLFVSLASAPMLLLPWNRRQLALGITGAGLGAWLLVQALAPATGLEPGFGDDTALRVSQGISAVGAYLLLSGLAFHAARSIAEAEQAAAAAHDRAQALLHNVLPVPVAERLQHARCRLADRRDPVAVIFADLCGFTALSARRPPDEVVALLDRVFTAFDALADRHGLEKIKTIGDAYMAAAGLPDPHPDPAGAAAELALDMLAAVDQLADELGEPLSLRIGVHVGPVVAGVIGARRLSYDLWGDTVNLASRMESHGEPGRVQVTEEVRAALGDRYRLAPRGSVVLKGMGPTPTWWLEGRSGAAEALSGGRRSA